MPRHGDISLNTTFLGKAVQRLERVVDDFIVELGNLGALVSIHVEGVGTMTFTSGHSNLDRTRSVAPTDLFQIGSQSKTVAAMVFVLLAREGRLHLDDLVSRYLDLPIDNRITIRQLLMNSSGLGEYTVSTMAARPDPTIAYSPRDLIALALPQGQIFEPGERFDYCNTGWVIAALIIEAIENKSFGDVVHERIVRPLGLRATAFGGTVPEGERMRCYMDIVGRPLPVETSSTAPWAFGAGDGISCAEDILAIYLSLLDAKSELEISLADLTKMVMKPSSDPYFPMSLGTQYGLGLERRAWAGSEVWGHPGSTYACRTSTWIDPAERIGVTTAITAHLKTITAGDELRYPRAQLFAMSLNSAYCLADAGKS